jgi:hypothetical protein
VCRKIPCKIDRPIRGVRAELLNRVCRRSQGGADTSPRLLSSVEMFDGAEINAGKMPQRLSTSVLFVRRCRIPSSKLAPSFKFSSSRGRRVKVELVPVVSTLGHPPSTRLGWWRRWAFCFGTAKRLRHVRRHGSRQGQRLMMRGLEEGQTRA